MRLALLLLGLVGCDARFVDLRLVTLDSSSLRDLGDSDLARVPGQAPGVLARGAFKGRVGHQGKGTATLERNSDGSVELVFGADFDVTPVPGPVVVLTAREDLGTSIAADDLDLGALQKSTGAQRYPLPGDDGGRRNAFVFCKPFGVEVAKADLE